MSTERDKLIAERARAFVLASWRFSTAKGKSLDAAADSATAELLALLDTVREGTPREQLDRHITHASHASEAAALSIIAALEDWDPMARPYFTPAEMVRAYCVEQGWIEQ